MDDGDISPISLKHVVIFASLDMQTKIELFSSTRLIQKFL